MKLTFYDKLFTILVVVFSLGLFVFNLQISAGPARQYITVHVDNEFVMEISFDESTEKQVVFPFGAAKEHTAVLEISGGKVRMLPMAKELCPRGICSHTGWISRYYQSIVCVPNRIVVSFSEQKNDRIDGVTF
ncbi:MAG: NusG domain II-containing protein [Bacillota bacterium]